MKDTIVYLQSDKCLLFIDAFNSTTERKEMFKAFDYVIEEQKKNDELSCAMSQISINKIVGNF